MNSNTSSHSIPFSAKHHSLKIYSRFGTKSYLYRPKVQANKNQYLVHPKQFQQLPTPCKYDQKDKEDDVKSTAAKIDF